MFLKFLLNSTCTTFKTYFLLQATVPSSAHQSALLTAHASAYYLAPGTEQHEKTFAIVSKRTSEVREHPDQHNLLRHNLRIGKSALAGFTEAWSSWLSRVHVVVDVFTG